MRVAGALTLVLGWAAAAVFALLPVTISVLGTSGSCGPPIVTTLWPTQSTGNATEDALVTECKHDSIERTVVAGVVWMITTIGGAGMIAWSRRLAPPPWPPYGPTGAQQWRQP
jgi:hypothetical protein